jgi:hypothetical protein
MFMTFLRCGKWAEPALNEVRRREAFSYVMKLEFAATSSKATS